MLLRNENYVAQIREAIEKTPILWDELRGASVLVTGAAGMLGSGVVDFLIYLNKY